MKKLLRLFFLLLFFIVSIKGTAYNYTYNVKVGEKFTVYTTYKSNTISVLWTYDGTSLNPNYIGSASTSVTFEAMKPSPSAGLIIQSITYYMQNGLSMKQVDDWLVHVDPIKVSSITITPYSSTLYVGQSVYLYEDISPSNASNKEVKWESLNTNIAEVNNFGLVQAKKAGSTKIRCTAEDGSGKYGECSITVNDPIAVTGLKLNPTTVTMNVRDKYTLTHTISPTNATYKDVKWSTSKSSVATVSSGTITAVGKGEADITCTSVDNNSVSAICHVVVNSVPVESISLDCKNATLGLNEKKQINATIFPSNATALTPKWESSNSQVAEVNQSGYVTAKSEGKTTIKCSASDDSGVYVTCEISVSNYKPTSISLPQSITIGVKETTPLTCTIQPSNATTTLSWSSANEQIASVTKDGVIKGIKEGSTVITVKTSEGLSAKCNVTVKKIEFDHSVKWTGMGNYSIDWYDKNATEYNISTNKQLAGLAYLVNNGYDDFKDKTINITNDISLYGKNWIGIGNAKYSFKGSFEGNGHLIEDVTIGNPENNQDHIGFFGYVQSNGFIRNFTIVGEIRINDPNGGCKNVGGLIGYGYYGNNWLYITNIDCQMPISFSRNLSLSSNEPSINFGGLIGNGYRCDVKNCRYTGKISVDQRPTSAAYTSVDIIGGGLVGKSVNCCFTYCETRCSDISATCPNWDRSNSSASMGTIKLGGLCGYASSWDIKYCLAITNFTVNHNGWPFTNYGHPNVYVGSLIGIYGTTGTSPYPNLYNNLAITSYVKKGTTAYVNLNFYDFPDKSKTNESNYSNSDAQVSWTNFINKNTYNGLRYKTSDIKTQAFVDELNNYPLMKEGKKVWTLNAVDGYPCLIEQLVNEITLSPTSGTLKEDETKQIKATVSPSDAKNKTVTWSSSNEDVATVSSTGVVTAKGRGKATITCEANDKSGVKAKCEITVLGTRNVTTSRAGYATFYDSQISYELPTGLKAEVVSSVANNKLSYTSVNNGIIPKGTAVMLTGTSKKAETYKLVESVSSSTYSGTNYLHGSDDVTTTSAAGDNYYFKLSYGNDSMNNIFGWYWGSNNGGAFRIDGHKAWLAIPKSSVTTRSFSIEGEVTGIVELMNDDTKAVIYDMQGRSIEAPNRSGLYIQNGKKVIIQNIR